MTTIEAVRASLTAIRDQMAAVRQALGTYYLSEGVKCNRPCLACEAWELVGGRKVRAPRQDEAHLR